MSVRWNSKSMIVLDFLNDIMFEIIFVVCSLVSPRTSVAG